MNQIKFESFIKKVKNNFFQSQKKVFCFVGQEYQVLFFGLLFDLLNDQNKLPAHLKKVDLDLKDKTLFYSELGQRFLGLNNFYWFSNLSDKLTAKNKTEILKFLSNYKGPHVISFFLKEDLKFISLISSDSVEMINVPCDINFNTFLNILDLFCKKINPKKLDAIYNTIFANSRYSLDSVCMLINYLELININSLKEFNDYLSIVIGSTTSLYSLSEFFFAKLEKKFFTLWYDLRKDYTDMFWIFYWSDQIWRAYYVVKYLNQKDFFRAKRMSFRLPLSFIKKDYKMFGVEKLMHLYDFLFSIDFAVKNGSSFLSLDLFYLNHFLDS